MENEIQLIEAEIMKNNIQIIASVIILVISVVLIVFSIRRAYKKSKATATSPNVQNSITESNNVQQKQSVRFCPNCGAAIEGNAQFCTKCGTAIS